MRKAERVSQLQNVSLFEGCSKRALGALASDLRSDQLDAGHTLLHQGAPSANLYVILAGSANVKRNGRKIADLGPGDTVGELGVILGEARNAEVTAATPLEVLVLDQRSLRRTIDAVPGFGWSLLQSVAGRLSSSDTRST